jgi:hypothetical protein
VSAASLALPAGDREDWRAKMAQQRKVDMETFGGMARAGGRRSWLLCC